MVSSILEYFILGAAAQYAATKLRGKMVHLLMHQEARNYVACVELGVAGSTRGMFWREPQFVPGRAAMPPRGNFGPS